MAVEVSSVKTDARPLGDLLRHEFHQAYNRISRTIKNPSGGTITLTDPLGLPVKLNGSQWEFVAAADIANAGGVLLYDKPMKALAAAGITEQKHAILVLGPALVHEDGLSAADHVGAAITAANFKSRLLTLGIVTVEGPDKTSTQTS